MSIALSAPFPWFGGKSKVADLVWQRFGDVPNYSEPFAGSLAVPLGRPHKPRIETVNDLDCVAPETRILRADLSWAQAGTAHRTATGTIIRTVSGSGSRRIASSKK